MPLITAAVPILVAVFTPRRRLIPAMALVVVSPAILYVAIIVWDVLTLPPQVNPLALVVKGFTIISVFVAPPWFVICFAIGLGLRRPMRRPGSRRRCHAIDGREHRPDAGAGAGLPEGFARRLDPRRSRLQGMGQFVLGEFPARDRNRNGTGRAGPLGNRLGRGHFVSGRSPRPYLLPPLPSRRHTGRLLAASEAPGPGQMLTDLWDATRRAAW